MKPIDLMRWLCRLVTPVGGTVLDPFMGSGSTGIAAHLEGLKFIGIEQELTYIEIAQARLAFWQEHGEDGLRIVAEQEAKHRAAQQYHKELADVGQLRLLDG